MCTLVEAMKIRVDSLAEESASYMSELKGAALSADPELGTAHSESASS